MTCAAGDGSGSGDDARLALLTPEELVRPRLRLPLPPPRYPGQDVAVLAPLASNRPKEWPLPCWLELERLLAGGGYRVVTLGNRREPLAAFAGETWMRRPPAQVIGLVHEAARLLVGADSALCHLAGALDRPALALCGPTLGRRIFSGWRSVRTLQGPLACSGCNLDAARLVSPDCHRGCASLQQLAVEEDAAQGASACTEGGGWRVKGGGWRVKGGG